MSNLVGADYHKPCPTCGHAMGNSAGLGYCSLCLMRDPSKDVRDVDWLFQGPPGRQQDALRRSKEQSVGDDNLRALPTINRQDTIDQYRVITSKWEEDFGHKDIHEQLSLALTQMAVLYCTVQQLRQPIEITEKMVEQALAASHAEGARLHEGGMGFKEDEAICMRAALDTINKNR